MQLKWLNSFQFAGYYMALEKDYYAQAGLDVEIISRDPKKNNILQVVDGNAEYGIADSAVLLYRAQGKQIKVLASIFQHSPLVFLVKKNSGIYGPQEMKGKIVSYQRGLDDAPLLAMLNDANLSEKDYQFAPLDFTSMAFIRGDVDVMSAYLSNEPFLMQEKGVDISIINPLNYGIDFYGDNIIAMQSELDHHPGRAKAFVDASIKGWKYALANKEETIALLRSKYGAKASVDHLRHEADVTERMIVPDLVEIGYTSVDRFYRIAEIYQHIGQINKVQAKAALEGLIYDPNNRSADYKRFLLVALGLLVFLSLAFIGVLLFNRRLKTLVAQRTRHLTELINFNETILTDSPLPMAAYNSDGYCVRVNEAFWKLIGGTREQMLAQNLWAISSIRECGLLEACELVLNEHKPQQREVHIVTTFGKELFLDARLLSTFINGQPHLLMQFIDRTESKSLELALSQSEARYARLSDLTFEGIIIHDGTNIVDVNGSFCKMFGSAEGELIGRPIMSMLTPDGQVTVSQNIAAKNSMPYQAECLRHDGTAFFAEIIGRDLLLTGRPLRVACVRDITDRKRLEEELRQSEARFKELARMDPLTSLANRRTLAETAEIEFQRGKRYGSSAALLMIDIDHFKDINDSYGHDAGDRALQALASTLKSVTRSIDLPSRLGGEEFVCLLIATGALGAMEMAERIRLAVSRISTQSPAGTFHFTVSIGCATFENKDHDWSEALSRADSAMYEAKKAGRNRIVCNCAGGTP